MGASKGRARRRPLAMVEPPKVELRTEDGTLDAMADRLANVIGEQLALAYIAQLEKAKAS